MKPHDRTKKPPFYPDPLHEHIGRDYGPPPYDLWWVPDFENGDDKAFESEQEAIAYLWDHYDKVAQDAIQRLKF